MKVDLTTDEIKFILSALRWDLEDAEEWDMNYFDFDFDMSRNLINKFASVKENV